MTEEVVWHFVRYHPFIYLMKLRNKMKMSVRTASPIHKFKWRPQGRLSALLLFSRPARYINDSIYVSVICSEYSKSRKNDWHHCCSVHSVLESVLRVWAVTSLWPSPDDTDKHCYCDFYPEPGTTQFCCKPSYLLSLLHTHVQDSEVCSMLPQLTD